MRKERNMRGRPMMPMNVAMQRKIPTTIGTVVVMTRTMRLNIEIVTTRTITIEVMIDIVTMIVIKTIATSLMIVVRE